MKFSLHNVRQDYSKKKLSVTECHQNPFFQFRIWLNEAIKSKINEPTAMNVATVSEDAKPSARVVLLKEINDQGLVFFSNYNSRKGVQLKHNSYVAVTFFWPELERQIRIEGKVNLLDVKESDAYFESRPYKSRVGAWVSKQSKILKSKTALFTSFALFRARNPVNIKRPSFWGGYIVEPEYFEFWQGRPSRLHDRIVYQLIVGEWQRSRLYP